MSILDDFTPTYSTNNMNKWLYIHDEENDIVVGSSCTHIFKFPFKYSEVVKNIEIIYKQGLSEPILIKDSDDVTVEEFTQCCGKEYSTVTLVLTPEETELFRDTLLDTFVQVKITNNKDEILYNEPTELEIRIPLDQ